MYFCLKLWEVHRIRSPPFLILNTASPQSGFPGGASGKEPSCQCIRQRRGFNPWVQKIPWRRAWQPTPVFLPGESHGQRSLAGLQSMGSQGVRHDWSDLAPLLLMESDCTWTLPGWVSKSESDWEGSVCWALCPAGSPRPLSPTRCLLFSGVCRRNWGSHRRWTLSLSPTSFPWLSGSRLIQRAWQWFTRWKTKISTWDVMTLWFCDSVFPSWLLTWMFGTVWGEMVWCFDWCYMLPNGLILDS